MNPPTVSQQQAINARGDVLVVAGAGTGKTSTLVERCVAVIEEGCSLEQILMVTYTEAAAAEMRHRIREALRQKAKDLETARRVQLSADLPSDESQKSNSIGTRPASTEWLKDHCDKQLALLDTANISTLHSFCLRLVREHFFELGIDPEVIVLDERQTEPLIRRTLETVFDRHYASPTEKAAAVQSLIRIQGRGSDEGIRTLVLRLHRYSQSLANPPRWLEEQLTRFQNAEPARWREWFVEGFQDWRRLWTPALHAFEGTPAIDLCAQALRSAGDSPSVDQVADAVQALQAADDDAANWPHGSVKKVRDHLKHFFADLEFLCSLTRRDGADPLAEDWGFVRGPMMVLLELAKEFAWEFGRAKREVGGVDFADLEQFALRLLRDPDTAEPTSIALGWRNQLQHIFVDEYQDINAAQDAILNAVSRHGSAANRFLVGDVKQSIYRFRLANPSIFRNYEAQWRSGSSSAHRIPLADNFRSRAGILDFINPLFSALMREDIGGMRYEPLNFGNAGERNALARGAQASPRVEFHLLSKGDNSNTAGAADDEPSPEHRDISDLRATEREARLVALRLLELRRERHEIWDKAEKKFRPVEWSDMAVLLRSPAGRGEAFAMEFNRVGVPLEAPRGGFFASTEVSDMLCLLKVIDNPLQDIPLLAVLRSPLVGLSINELAEIRAHNREASFWLTLSRFHRNGQSPADRGPNLSSAWEKVDLFKREVEAWRQLIRESSLSHCLETALADTFYEEFLMAEPRGEQRAANIRRFLDLARQYDPYQRQGLFRFLRFVEAQEEMEVEFEPAPAPAAHAVRLMSIHRSKGLEFPVVALAGLAWQFNLRDLREDILLDEEFGLCPKVTLQEGEQRYPSLPYWLASRRQRRELLGEEMRLLYVAMTRARDTLILTATSSTKGDPRWSSAEAENLSNLKILSARSYLDWLRMWFPQVTRESDWTSDREGRSELLCWKIYPENDSRLVLPVNSTQTGSGESIDEFTQPALERVRERVAWPYPFAVATEERAKTNVTELRRRSTEEDEEVLTARFGRRKTSAAPTNADESLTAADIGTAHHLFLQMVDLRQTGNVPELKQETERLCHASLLTMKQAEALDLGAIESFWQSEAGQRIRRDAQRVKRELPFTARFSLSELADVLGPSQTDPTPPLASPNKDSSLPLGLEAQLAGGRVSVAAFEEDFVIVQGVIDLAVLLPAEIWLVDFKTDEVNPDTWREKAGWYKPQLELYARALARIYRRPVSNCWLHFLKLRRTISFGAG